MPSQFFGLNIAASALNAFQASVNTAANNVSNVQTKGYSKQVTNKEAGEGMRVNAKYGTTGTGVNAVSVTQLRDSYYDTKYWNNNGNLGLYQKRLYYMEQIQTYFTDDDTEKGFSTLLKTMFNNLDTTQHTNFDENVRKQFIGSAQSLATYFNGVATNLQELQGTLNNEIKSTVDNVNSIAEKIALINKQINQVEINGGHANELRDKRVLGGRKGGMPEMVFEYILKNHNIDPASDLEIDQSIDFGSTAAAFTGDMSADFTVEFEPSATALEKEGKGYVVASLGVDSGYVPYTSYSAKTSFLNENPQIIQSFTNALQKGMDYVQSHSPEEIAQVISPQFPETDMDTLTTIVKRYYEQDTWKENLIFEKDSFELLQDILESAGELSDRADCENLVTTAFAEAAIS